MDKSLLECEASSNPPVLNFTWMRYNRTLGESFRNEPLSLASMGAYRSSVLNKGRSGRQKSIIVLENNDLDAYSCVATNIIGSSPPCRLKIQQIFSKLNQFYFGFLSTKSR